ncbi:CocE/NonD family hydrolase [Marinobacter sp. NP-4(2019)]|uniref:CocE/NonD family hydrolase n=1 Tax=Marinobacter sp. NP-4(2019) TaxID=2488665 RepID=UPI000FC3F176|nr:CocE/NonD family hydrolase [Marinobacter sp. NP-4(2019)]AZT83932.1 CocE/NonD family hydrolase [Marinobacter sp. NP-4(2019)]
MKIVDNLPEQVRHIEHQWIPMHDGTRLAARLWIPESAYNVPVPAIFEYIPYRKRDGSRLRDETMHPYFAGHGYACIRVDIRGSGDSEGILTDEYLQQELDDGVAVLDWLEEQPWCSGEIGMIGISWGGFNGLQIAAMQPPQLRAVVSVCSTDDRYADDVHYMGGCLLGDNLSWASTMFSYNSLPPDPEIVGGRWREMWFQRLENSGLWLETWLQHQHRDAYWRHGSICEDFSAVKIPVMAVSGWADGYSNAVFRLLEELPGERIGLIGPWSHKYPHIGVPGPAIGFLQECLRWWEQWLKGKETGIRDEPMLRVWMLDSMAPSTSYHQRYGRWISEGVWPPKSRQERIYNFSPYRLVETNEDSEDVELTLQSPLSNGLFAGKWCSYSNTPDLPHDQREEDGGALTFTSEPLEEALEILGAPIVDLELSASQPVAMIAVRLSDMRPDNKVTRISYGLLNLTHHISHASPEPLTPAQRYRNRVQLNGIAQTLPRGHRIRIAISTSYFPLAWPPPKSTQLKIHTRGCRLALPVRSPRDENIRFPDAEMTASGRKKQFRKGRHDWRVIRELDRDISTLEVINDNGIYYLEDVDLTIEHCVNEWYSYHADDFSSARGETLSTRAYRRGNWHIKTVTRTTLTCDEKNFYLDAELDAFEGTRRVYSRNWNRIIARQLV